MMYIVHTRPNAASKSRLRLDLVRVVFLSEIIRHLLVMGKEFTLRIAGGKGDHQRFIPLTPLKLPLNQTLLRTLLSRTVTFHGNRKQRAEGGEENAHLKPCRPFNIHESRDCGGSHKVWNVKPPKKRRGGCHRRRPGGLLCIQGKSRERGEYSRGRAEEVDEKMSCLRAAPGSLRGGAAQ